MTISQDLRQAIDFQRQGQLIEAERLYRAILEIHPKHGDAHHNLGVLAMQMLKADLSLEHLKTALDVNPAVGRYWLSYAEALVLSGRPDSALSILDQALKTNLSEGDQELLRARQERLKSGMGEKIVQFSLTSDMLDQPVSLDDGLRQVEKYIIDKNWPALQAIAQRLVADHTHHPVSWRCLAIASVLNGKSLREGNAYFAKAIALGDEIAVHLQSFLNAVQKSKDAPVPPGLLLAQMTFLQSQESAYLDYPSEVHLETLAICNAACNFCPYPTMERQGDRMENHLIDKIINDLKEIPTSIPFFIAPNRVNEPFLDKRIISVYEKINHNLPNARIRIFSNGSALTEKTIHKLADIRNIEVLWISLNESSKTAYEEVMQISFDKTIQTLDRLHRVVLDKFPHPVTLSRVADGTERDGQFVTFVKERFPAFRAHLINRADWAGQVETSTNNMVPPTGCTRWFQLSIMASGKVALCCFDGEGKHVIGDTNTHSVLDIYNSPDYRKLREFTLNRKAARTPCDGCNQ